MAGGMHGGVGACVAGACVVGGCVWWGHAWWGHEWWGACMAGGHAGGECITKGACMAGGHAWQRGGGRVCHSRYYGIRSMSGRYASYWNAFLFKHFNRSNYH